MDATIITAVAYGQSDFKISWYDVDSFCQASSSEFGEALEYVPDLPLRGMVRGMWENGNIIQPRLLMSVMWLEECYETITDSVCKWAIYLNA